MDFNKITQMLGENIPNILKEVKKMERDLSPFMAEINKNSDKMTDEQRATMNKYQAEIKKYKKQLNDLSL